MTTALAQATDRKPFLQAFNRLAVALRLSDADEVTLEVYFEALRDLPTKAVEEAATTLAKERGRKFFPTTAEWREVAEQVCERKFRQAIEARPEPWKLECEVCEDAGWRFFECPGDASCGREQKHAAHSYVKPCVCRATNRTYQRHQQTAKAGR